MILWRLIRSLFVSSIVKFLSGSKTKRVANFCLSHKIYQTFFSHQSQNLPYLQLQSPKLKNEQKQKMTKHTLVRALIKAQTQIRTSILTRSLCTSPSPDTALKNVTRLNFEPVLAELRRVVREADFVSIDLEMTGLTSAPWRECFEFDRPDIQYLKVKDSAEKFAVVQFGVCPFSWDSATYALVAHP